MKKFSLLLVFFLFGCQSLNKQIEQFKAPEIAAEQTHQQFESRNLETLKADEKKMQIALFLPFSGKNKDLGWSLFNAATLSLFENDTNHNLELILIDSKDTPQEAKKAFREIVSRDIKVVIGPVFSNVIEEIDSAAKSNKIAVISLSNNQELMGKINDDGGIFLAGMLPETQIDKIVGYAMERGKYSFAIIAPNNQYGKTITDLYKRIVRDRDGNFITAEFYEPNSKDVDRPVERVINSFSLPARLMDGKNKLKKNAVANESDRSYPQVIMIPESGKMLSRIMASIKKQNKDERDFQIVGSSQWDDISTLNDFHLIGTWFPAPESEKFRNFEKSYYRSFNKFPPRISSIVYDSVAAVAELANRKKGQVLTVKDFTNFTNPPKNGFEGVDGLFRFLPNGLVQRNLAVLQVANGHFETADKPAEQFLKY